MIKNMFVLKNIRKKFDKNEVLKNISFSLPNCGMIFLMGRSGSGKTTLLDILATFIEDYSGEYYYNRVAIHKLSKKQLYSFQEENIAYGFQEDYLMQNETVFENLKIVFYALGYEKICDYEKIIETELIKFGLLDKKDIKVRYLSGGEKARVSLIRTLIKPASIYLIDEPTSDLDSDSSKIVYNALQEKAKNSLVIVVSHNILDCKMYGDYILFLENGVIKEYKKNKKITSFDLNIENEVISCKDLSDLIYCLEYDKNFSLVAKEDDSTPMRVEIAKKSKVKYRSILKETGRMFYNNKGAILSHTFISSILLSLIFFLSAIITFPKATYYYRGLVKNEDNLNNYEIYYESESTDNFPAISIKKGILFEELLENNKYFPKIKDGFARYINVDNHRLLINENENYDGIIADKSLEQDLNNPITLFGNEISVSFQNDRQNKLEISRNTIDKLKENSDFLIIKTMPISVFNYYNATLNDCIESIGFSNINPDIKFGNESNDKSEIVISLNYARKLLYSKYHIEFSEQEIENSLELKKELLGNDLLGKPTIIFNLASQTYHHYYDNYLNIANILQKGTKIVGISDNNYSDIYVHNEIYSNIANEYYSYYFYDGTFFEKSTNIRALSNFLSHSPFIVEGFGASYHFIGMKTTLKLFKNPLILFGILFFILGIVEIIMLHNSIKRYLTKRNILLKSFGMKCGERKKERLAFKVLLSLVLIFSIFIISLIFLILLKFSEIVAKSLLILSIWPFIIIASIIIITEAIIWIFERKSIEKVNKKLFDL